MQPIFVCGIPARPRPNQLAWHLNATPSTSAPAEARPAAGASRPRLAALKRDNLCADIRPAASTSAPIPPAIHFILDSGSLSRCSAGL
jgi:hypothetical protein